MKPGHVHYDLVPPCHRFSFAGPDGAIIEIGEHGIETDNPLVIAELDAHPEHVALRAKKPKAD